MIEKHYIDKGSLLKSLTTSCDGSKIPDVDCDNFPITINLKDLRKIICKQPDADVQAVIHGYWKEVKCGEGLFDYYFECSHCGNNTPPGAFPVAPDYCPNCPAKMDGRLNYADAK